MGEKLKTIPGGIEASDPCLLKIALKSSDVRLPASTGHDRNFLDSVRTRASTLTPLEAAVRSDTISHLSDVAVRTGREPERRFLRGNVGGQAVERDARDHRRAPEARVLRVGRQDGA